MSAVNWIAFAAQIMEFLIDICSNSAGLHEVTEK
jgi:hypothetical protein